MKKVISVILVVVMMFSVMGMAASASESELDEQIEKNAKSLVSQFMPEPSEGLLEVITAFNKILNWLAPVYDELGEPEIKDFALKTGDNADETFKVCYRISTDMNFTSLRTNIITMYEYRVYDGEEWSEWGYVYDSNGIPVLFTRFNYGYIKDAETGTKYNESITKNRVIPANTLIYSSPSLSKMASIDSLKDGTKYEIRVLLTVNNTVATATQTSGVVSFTKGA